MNKCDFATLLDCELLYVEPFWFGIKVLFEINILNHQRLRVLHQLLSQHEELRVSALVDIKEYQGRTWMLYDYIAGETLTEFSHQQITLLAQHLARQHSICSPQFGDVMQRFDACQFKQKLLDCVDALYTRFRNRLQDVDRYIEQFRRDVAQLKASGFSLILLDQDATQYHYDDVLKQITLVDTELLLYASVEFDLKSLELLLNDDAQLADTFTKSYSALAPFPNLGHTRMLYRFLHRILEVQGSSQPFAYWMNKRALF